MLSTFESALLARHLRGCADCRAFAAGSTAQTQLLRGAELEQPLLQVALPSRRRPVRRIAAGALSTAAAVAAAVSFTFVPSGNQPQTSAADAGSAVQTGAPVLVVVAAQPSLGTDETVPRLKMEAASVADGPVHGLFNTPMSA
jgi:hypothetical protein